MVREVAEQVRLIDNLKAVAKTVPEKRIQVFIVPHLASRLTSSLAV